MVQKELNEVKFVRKTAAWRLILPIGVGVFGAWLGFGWYYHYCFGGFPTTEADAGHFGSMFGALNTLLSGGALIGAIIAIYLQREELRLTRKEVIAQTEALQQQGESLERQYGSMEQTRLEMQFQRNLNNLSVQIQAFQQLSENDVTSLRKLVKSLSSDHLIENTIKDQALLTQPVWNARKGIDHLHSLFAMGAYIAQQEGLQQGNDHLLGLNKIVVRNSVGSEILCYLDANYTLVLKNVEEAHFQSEPLRNTLKAALRHFGDYFHG